MSDPREAALLAALDRLGIGWERHEHAAVFTVEESAGLHHAIAGLHTKNLFLKDAAARFWLVTVPHDIRVDLKALPGAIGSKKVSFGKADDMERLLGIAPGSVTPLAAFNDGEGLVRIVLDAALAGAGVVNVHPLRNTATLSLRGTGLIRALEDWRHDPLVVAVPQVG